MSDWQGNYFNYYTEVEEHFQRARGTALFLLSPLDWALIEAWKNAGVPLEAVLRGIDTAFEKWHAKKKKTQAVNSLTFCAQAVMQEAEIMAGAVPEGKGKPIEAPFTLDELRDHLTRNAADLREQTDAVFLEIADSLERMAGEAEDHYRDLEQLEQRLTGLEDKMVARARSLQTEEELFQARRELDLQLRQYRSKMTADQLAMLEKQFLDRGLLERKKLPRLSLFYLR